MPGRPESGEVTVSRTAILSSSNRQDPDPRRCPVEGDNRTSVELIRVPAKHADDDVPIAAGRGSRVRTCRTLGPLAPVVAMRMLKSRSCVKTMYPPWRAQAIS